MSQTCLPITVLAELARMGHATMPDAAREIIAERRRRGLPPRPDPVSFASDVLARELAAHAVSLRCSGWSFHERGVVDAAGLALESGVLTPAEAAALVERHPVHRPVFVFPPWRAIYRRDEERDQDRDEAVAVHGRIVRWYAACGYGVHEVRYADPLARARHVLRVLGEPRSPLKAASAAVLQSWPCRCTSRGACRDLVDPGA